MRYCTNLIEMVYRQQGFRAAIGVGSRFVIAQATKLPRFGCIVISHRGYRRHVDKYFEIYSDEIVNALSCLPVEMKTYEIGLEGHASHLGSFAYPPNYAAGPMDEGGHREQKLLEYFVSLDLLDIQPNDVVVDVASEWSIFPEVVRKLKGARVYKQDLIYRPGIHGDYIGSSAENMPVPDGFADKLVLHNAFEHFEGMADSDFILEAWRVLKPGGTLAILPLLVSGRHTVLTDPLVGRRGIVWDEEAQVTERLGFNNRFARFYDATTLRERVLTPGRGFNTTIRHVLNTEEVHSRAYLHFALVMQKPMKPS